MFGKPGPRFQWHPPTAEGGRGLQRGLELLAQGARLSWSGLASCMATVQSIVTVERHWGSKAARAPALGQMFCQLGRQLAGNCCSRENMEARIHRSSVVTRQARAQLCCASAAVGLFFALAGEISSMRTFFTFLAGWLAPSPEPPPTLPKGRPPPHRAPTARSQNGLQHRAGDKGDRRRLS